MALELPLGQKIRYARQYRRCGKERCTTCRDGAGHGPYWYAFWEEAGRSRSRYLGKQLPPSAASETSPANVPVDDVGGAGVLPRKGLGAPRPADTPSGVLRVRTLGGFAVWRGTELILRATGRTNKAVTLFKYLLSSEAHSLHRDQVVDLLWPDRDPAAAAHGLHYTVHLLRRVLDAPGASQSHVQMSDDVLRLLPGLGEGSPGDWLDATTFARRAKTALSGHDRAAYRAALTDYGGEYLPDDRYADWALARRAELQGLYLALLVELAVSSRAQGDVKEAIRSLQAILAADRLHERAARLLMEVLAAEGRYLESDQVYRVLRAALYEELAVAPAGETVRLHARLLAHPGNLPTPLTSFIGRRKDQEALSRLLAATRLLTLTGAGGSGKTRLALEVATARQRAYGHGAWLVELASLDDAALTPQRVAEVLGVQEQAGESLLRTLASYLRERELLLVLDNCEHVLESCAALAAVLLGGCPGLHILATSREALGVGGETVWRVPALSLPLSSDSTSLAAGMVLGSSGPRHGDWTHPVVGQDEEMTAMSAQSEAVQLFVVRARACRQDFVVRAETAGLVARICRQLDGLPLAIELAAARISHLPLEGIAALLSDRLRLLTSGPRTVLPRHQTLRAVMDWSFDLLADRERILLRRLAVFAGGWTLGAVEMVCAGAGIEARHMLDLLGALVNKSLVVPVEHDGAGRYRLLETVREYAWERLLVAEETPALRNRHLAWCVGLAEEAEPALRGAEQERWLARLDAEIDNFRTALNWSRQETAQAAQGERLAGLLWRYWIARGYLSEGRRRLDQFLADRGEVAAGVRAGSLLAAGRLAYYQSDFAQATTLYEEGLALSQTTGNRSGVASAYNGLGLVLVEQGRYEQATTLFEQGLALNRDLLDSWAAAGTLNNLGMAAHRQGDYARTAIWLEQSLTLYREVGDKQGTANTLNTWGVAAMDAGDIGTAITLLEESLDLYRDLENAHGMAIALSNLGMLARTVGEYERAGALLGEGLAIFQKLETEAEIGMCLEALALIAGVQGKHGRAARLFGAADARRVALGAPLPAPERVVHDAAVEPVRAALGEEAFARLWAAGQAMSSAQAVACALEIEPGASSSIV